MSVSFPYRGDNAATKNEAAQRGIDAHAACEQYLLRHAAGDATTTNPYPGSVNMDFPALADKSNLPEQQWGFDKLWKPVPFFEGWLKLVADVVVPTPAVNPTLVTIIDFKTGKRVGNEPKHTMQTQLYLAAAAQVYPEAQEFASELWYLDHDLVFRSPTYNRDKLTALRLRWDTRARRMTEATEYPPKPSRPNCRFCDQKDRCEFAWEEQEKL
jgi:hypothetical protein